MIVDRWRVLVWSLMFAFLVSKKAQAIVNIESSRPTSGNEGVSGDFSLKGFGSSGNTEKYSISAQSNTLWRRGSASNFFILSYVYGQSSGVKDQNQAFMHIRHVESFEPRWSWELFSQLQSDEFRRLKWRFLAGGGLRHELRRLQDGALYLGAGAFYSREEISETSLVSKQSETTARGNLYVSYRQGLDGPIRMAGTLYFQPRYDRFRDFHLLWDSQMTVRMNETISLLVELKVAHDNEPPRDVEKTDVTYLLGFSLNY